MTPGTLTPEETEKLRTQTREERQTRAEAVVRRGKEIYETQLRAQLEPDNVGKFLLIETTTGEYEIIRGGREALALRLHELGPGPTRFIMLIGYAAASSWGGASLKPLVPHQRNGKYGNR